jgi:hypothetical protein
MITKEGLRKAWEDAINKPVYFDHKPTVDDILDIRLQAVADYVIKESKTTVQSMRL